MATIVTRYLDGASAGGNGTTNALTGVNAAYSSFASWQTAEVKNLVTANEIHKLVCSGGLLDDYITITGWTTDIDRFVWITVDAASRHNGTPGSGFRLKGNHPWTYLFRIGQPDTIVEWLEVENTAPAGNFGGVFYLSGGSNSLLIGCIASNSFGRSLFSSNGTSFNAVSCLGFGGTASAFDIGQFGKIKLYNCTFAGTSSYGFNKAHYGTLDIVNCVGFDNLTADFNNTGPISSTSGYNASGDTSALGANTTTGVVAGDFTNTAVNDYSVSGTTSNLYAAGRSIASELAVLDRTQYTVPKLDLAGNPLTTDIGAFAYVASGGSTFQAAWATMANRLIGGL